MITKLSNLSEILTLARSHKKDGRKLIPEDKSIIKNGCVIFDDNEILWVGKQEEANLTDFIIDKEVDLTGHTLCPELVDSHTHLVFCGDRAQEYSMRLDGRSYEEIATAGGGILASAKKTQLASEEELFLESVKKIEKIHSYGIGTIEIKSGYGLTYESEKKLSLVINKLKNHFREKVQIKNTYMAAHAIPKEFKTSEEYLQELVIPLLKDLAPMNIIDNVDIFFEQNYFTKKDCESLFELAHKLNLGIKVHADELNTNFGAELAVKHKLLSADHLLKVSDTGIKMLAESNTVATLLPGTALFLGKTFPPARKLLDQGCRVAIASDYNPGSCHCDNLLLIASIAGKNLGMNSCELWSAITLNAAKALGLSNQGAIISGMKPRFTIFKSKSSENIFYEWGKNLVVKELFQ